MCLGHRPRVTVTELVWPTLNAKEGYEAATVMLKDAPSVTEFKQTEPPVAVAVRDLASRLVWRIPRRETKKVKLGGSVMRDELMQ